MKRRLTVAFWVMGSGWFDCVTRASSLLSGFFDGLGLSFAAELVDVEFVVVAAFCEELFVGTLFFDFSFLDDEDLVG